MCSYRPSSRVARRMLSGGGRNTPNLTFLGRDDPRALDGRRTAVRKPGTISTSEDRARRRKPLQYAMTERVDCRVPRRWAQVRDTTGRGAVAVSVAWRSLLRNVLRRWRRHAFLVPLPCGLAPARCQRRRRRG